MISAAEGDYMEKLDMMTKNIADRNFEVLSKLFPNAITESVTDEGEVIRTIDADILQQEISCNVICRKEDRYFFSWPNKREAILAANEKTTKTLRLNRKKSIGKNGEEGGIDSENLYIEGDNLDTLKLLRETYLGKIKMVYIDPPYNTGKDFIYNDDFSEGFEEYVDSSGQYDSSGNRLVLNTETNGRFHTDWLNMLYPRLKLSKDLLSDDGMIFISIDDNEVANLRKMCDEIFGEKCFVAQNVWQKRTSPDARRIISAGHEYILVYVKNSMLGHNVLNSLPFDENDYKRYKNPDNDPNGPWISTDCTAQAGHGTKEQFYDMITPSGRVVKLQDGLCWRYTKKRMDEEVAAGHIWFGADGNGVPRKKTYLSDRAGKTMWTWWPNSEVGHTQEATKELASMLGASGVMDFPKPLRLMQRIVHIGTKKDSIILDFFSGSSTTAHAVIKENSLDDGNRRFIMVQLPEVCEDGTTAKKNGYDTICDIGEERIKRAGRMIKKETNADIDYGYRVFSIDSSNMKDVYYNPADTEQTLLDMFADNIKPDRTPEDLLFQVMLDLGVLLSSKIEETEIAGKKVFNVADGFFIACFDKDVTDEVIKAVANMKPYYAVFRDNSMRNDSVATNFDQIFENISPDTIRKVL